MGNVVSPTPGKRTTHWREDDGGGHTMARWLARLLLVAGCISMVLLAGCGGGSNKKAAKGGTLTVLTNGDVDDKLDRGYSYYQPDSSTPARPSAPCSATSPT